MALCLASSSVLSVNTAQAGIFPVTVNNDNGTGLVANTLSWAILQANQSPGADEILLQTDVTVTGVMKRLIDSDTTLTSDTTRRTISGNDEFRPLFIKSGQVTIKNVDIRNGLAKGGGSGEGGDGAGLGGCLFIYDGDISINNSGFNHCNAINSEQHYFGQTGGGGMFGRSHRGGGGLFSRATNNNGAYNGYGNYQNIDSDFAQGGRYGDLSHGGNGGFGAGGGYGYYGNGGNGGFGGGGGYTLDFGLSLYFGGKGGFGAGGGKAWENSPNDGEAGFGGDGQNSAGMGGAIFIRSGSVDFLNSEIHNSSATKNNSTPNQAEAFGGGIFVLHTLQNTNGNNQGMPASLPAVKICDLWFDGNQAETAPQSSNNNNDYFDLADLITFSCELPSEISVLSNGIEISDGDVTPSESDSTDFGSVAVNAQLVSKTYTINNSGQGELNLTGKPVVEIQNSSGQFTVTQQPLSNTLNYQDEVTFEVTFNPTTEGSDTATISIANNDPDENPFDFVIAAEGVEPQPKLIVTHNDQVIAAEDETPSVDDGTDFGYTPVAGGLIEQTFELHNVGFAPLELSNQANSITTTSQFNDMTITSQLSQFELQPNESLPFTVAFDPNQVGPSGINYVNITSNDPDFSNYYFQVTGYGQATMYLNAVQTDIQEGEVLVFEVATDLPVYDHASFQFALTGGVDESDFTQSSSVLSGQAFLTAGYSRTIFNFSTVADGVYEGVEHLTFGILSDDPAINQTTPFILAGSIDDDYIFDNGFETLTVRQLNKKLNQQAGEQTVTCDFSSLNCTFLEQQINLANFSKDTQTQQYVYWLQHTLQSQEPQKDSDNDGLINEHDASPLGLTFDIIVDHETE